ncbi:MAG: hypothetical protein WA890_19105, partial [Micromonospora sp.]
PEEIRRRMAALQAGTARGRRDGARGATEERAAAGPGAPATPDQAAEPTPPEPVQASEPLTATERDA